MTGVAGGRSDGRDIEAERTVLTVGNATANAGIGLRTVGSEIHENRKSEQVSGIDCECGDYRCATAGLRVYRYNLIHTAKCEIAGGQSDKSRRWAGNS